MLIEQLTAAIKARAPISFEYLKHPGARVGNPHVLFVLPRQDGHETTKVAIVQTDGFSESGGTFPFWRTFDLDKITLIAVHEERAPFEISSAYNPTADVYKFMIAKV